MTITIITSRYNHAAYLHLATLVDQGRTDSKLVQHTEDRTVIGDEVYQVASANISNYAGYLPRNLRVIIVGEPDYLLTDLVEFLLKRGIGVEYTL